MGTVAHDGAIALGPTAMTSPDTFDLGVISTAVVLRMALAVLYGVVLAFVIVRLDMGVAIAIGAICGFALYLANFYVFTKWFLWFADARDWISIFTHLVQGGLWAYLYKVLARRAVARTALGSSRVASGDVVSCGRLAIRPIAYSEDVRCVLRLLQHPRNEVDPSAQGNVKESQ